MVDIGKKHACLKGHSDESNSIIIAVHIGTNAKIKSFIWSYISKHHCINESSHQRLNERFDEFGYASWVTVGQEPIEIC